MAEGWALPWLPAPRSPSAGTRAAFPRSANVARRSPGWRAWERVLEAADALFACLFPLWREAALPRCDLLRHHDRSCSEDGGSGALDTRWPLPGLQLCLCLQPIYGEEERCCWWLESAGWIIFARVNSKNLDVGMQK